MDSKKSTKKTAASRSTAGKSAGKAGATRSGGAKMR